MPLETEEFLIYLDQHPELTLRQAFLNYLELDKILLWTIPSSFSKEDIENQLSALAEIGIEEIY